VQSQNAQPATLFVFVFLFRIRPNSLKPLFGTPRVTLLLTALCLPICCRFGRVVSRYCSGSTSGGRHHWTAMDCRVRARERNCALNRRVNTTAFHTTTTPTSTLSTPIYSTNPRVGYRRCVHGVLTGASPRGRLRSTLLLFMTRNTHKSRHYTYLKTSTSVHGQKKRHNPLYHQFRSRDT